MTDIMAKDHRITIYDADGCVLEAAEGLTIFEPQAYINKWVRRGDLDSWDIMQIDPSTGQYRLRTVMHSDGESIEYNW
jgi:hypothetical protein